MNLTEIREMCGKCPTRKECGKSAYQVAKCEVEALEDRLAEAQRLLKDIPHPLTQKEFDEWQDGRLLPYWEFIALWKEEMEVALGGAPQEEKKK